MKRILVLLIPLVIFPLIFVNIAFASDELKAKAVQKLQKAVIEALPDESGIIRIAVFDIGGDDGTIKNAITSAVTEKTTLKVIERADLDKVLAEQGLQLKDIIDERSGVKHGRIKGVQGLLMGKALNTEKGFLSYTIKVHLKLDDVEKGEILFSRDFRVTYVSPWRKVLIGAVIIVFFVIYIILRIGKKKIKGKEKSQTEDVKARAVIIKEISRAMLNITQIVKELMSREKTNEAIMLKDAEKDLKLLKEHVENAARGSVDMRGEKEFTAALQFDKKAVDSFTYLNRSTDNLYNTVISGDTSSLEEDIDILKQDIKNTTNNYKGRTF